MANRAVPFSVFGPSFAWIVYARDKKLYSFIIYTNNAYAIIVENILHGERDRHI